MYMYVYEDIERPSGSGSTNLDENYAVQFLGGTRDQYKKQTWNELYEHFSLLVETDVISKH